jgi:hypothetical protein
MIIVGGEAVDTTATDVTSNMTVIEKGEVRIYNTHTSPYSTSKLLDIRDAQTTNASVYGAYIDIQKGTTSDSTVNRYGVYSDVSVADGGYSKDAAYAFYGKGSGAGKANSSFGIYIAEGTSSFQDPVIINSSAALTPQLKLDRVTGAPSILATDNHLIMDSAGTAAALNYYSADAVLLAYGGGNVGIGTTSPVDLLHVYQGSDSFSGPVVKFQHHEATLDTHDMILDLDFSQDTSIGSANYFILFQDGAGTVGSINSEVAYSTFTGQHISQRSSGSSFSNWRGGMIVKSTGNIISSGSLTTSSLAMAWPEVDLTTTQKDKAVMGVFYETGSRMDQHPAFISGSIRGWKGLNNSLPSINYNAIGEGRILVTDTNGNIETGDYICSSVRTGHGEKQDDDILHNYTVAKATQPYNFTSASNDTDLGYKSVLIACTYHCG